MNIGQRIKQQRKLLRLSADDLGKRLGKNRATIYRYENGEIENLPLDVLEPLAEALETTPAYLMGWEDATNEGVEEIKEKNNNEKIAIGQLLKQIREQHNLTLQEMASEISISTNTLQKYESGEVEAPQVILKAYSKYFGIDINELLHVKIDEKSSHSSFISTNPDLVENIERWESEIGYNVFSKEEIDKIFEYAKFLLYLKEQK